MRSSARIVGLVALLATTTLYGQQPKPTVKLPDPGVPEIMTIEGHFIRVAYNNEGYVVMGYEVANRSVGDPWMLLEVGLTVRSGVPDYTLKRDAVSLTTPDGRTVPLPTTPEYREAANLVQGAQMRQKVQRDSINYFPPSAHQACRLGFFSDIEDRAVAWDQVELTSNRGCVGRLYFPVQGGVAYGQYFLNVKFEKSVVRVPFRVFTKEEEKKLSKHYGDIKKQIDAAFKPKKK
jgi:hypothetical protein